MTFLGVKTAQRIPVYHKLSPTRKMIAFYFLILDGMVTRTLSLFNDYDGYYHLYYFNAITIFTILLPCFCMKNHMVVCIFYDFFLIFS